MAQGCQWPQGLDCHAGKPRGAQGDPQPWEALWRALDAPSDPGQVPLSPSTWAEQGSPATGRSPTYPPLKKNRHKGQGAELIHLIFPSQLIKSRVTFGKSC